MANDTIKPLERPRPGAVFFRSNNIYLLPSRTATELGKKPGSGFRAWSPTWGKILEQTMTIMTPCHSEGDEMRALSLADSVSINPDVLFRELDGDAVLLSLETGTYYGLDPVGTKMWQSIAELGSLRLVFEAMLREYDVDAATLERDLLRLVNDLCAKGLSMAAV